MKTFGMIYHVSDNGLLLHIVGAGSVDEINTAISEALDMPNTKCIISHDANGLERLSCEAMNEAEQ